MAPGIISEERSSYVTSGREEMNQQQPEVSPEDKHAPKPLQAGTDSDDEEKAVEDQQHFQPICRTLEDLEMKYRIQEGLVDFPKDTDNLYSARLAVAADRPDEALHFMVEHLR